MEELIQNIVSARGSAMAEVDAMSKIALRASLRRTVDFLQISTILLRSNA
jgi:hypothetical protein